MWVENDCFLQGTSQTSPSPPPSAAATDEDRGETKRARQRKRKDPEVVDERTMRMQKRMVSISSSKSMFFSLFRDQIMAVRSLQSKLLHFSTFTRPQAVFRVGHVSGLENMHAA